MTDLILQRLLNNQLILNAEFIALCEQKYNIKIGPRTKGFIREFVTEIYIDKEDNLEPEANEIIFTVMCTHEDAYNNDYELPNGLKELFNQLANKLTESE